MLLLVAVILVMLAALGAALITTSRVQARAIGDTIELSRATYVAEGAIGIARGELWEGFVGSAGKDRSLESFRAYLDHGLGGIVPGVPRDLSDLVPDLGLPVSELTVERMDALDGGRVELEFRALIETGAGALEVLERHRTEGTPFGGLEFAMLTNDVNCIFCHASFDSVRKYDRVPYPPVKIASLESVRARTGSGSSVAGSLYVRGTFADKSGRPLSNPSSVITGVATTADGLVRLDASGNSIPQSLQAGVDYFPDYPVDPHAQDHGSVPGEFPPTFPDANRNGVVDDAEFQTIAGQSTGRLSGGVVVEVPAGSTHAGAGLPTAGNRSTITGSSGGHLLLVGTPERPIEIEGRVAVDGDLVIQGTVQGAGTLWARGNVYVLGNLTYADGRDASGRRTFGVAADGTANALGLAAGGMILLGDYLETPNVLPDSGGSMSFTQIEMAIFNRREFARTQPVIPDRSGNPVPNPLYTPGYRPSFYGLAGNHDVPVFLSTNFDPLTATWSSATGSKSYWDPALETWGGSERPNKFTETMVMPRSALPAEWNVLGGLPTADWLSSGQLEGLWAASEARHNGGPMQVDSMLYTNSGIFAMASSKTRYGGQMVINGGLVARDMGILVPKGLEVNYDERVARFFGVTDLGDIRLVRTGTQVQVRAPLP